MGQVRGFITKVATQSSPHISSELNLFTHEEFFLLQMLPPPFTSKNHNLPTLVFQNSMEITVFKRNVDKILINLCLVVNVRCCVKALTS